jgi:hypothetical protein
MPGVEKPKRADLGGVRAADRGSAAVAW